MPLKVISISPSGIMVMTLTCHAAGRGSIPASPNQMFIKSSRVEGGRKRKLGTMEQNLPQPFLKALSWPLREEQGSKGAAPPS